MSDSKINDSYYRRERDELDAWIAEKAAAAQPEGQKPAPKPATKKPEGPGLGSRLGAAIEGLPDVTGRPEGTIPSPLETVGDVAVQTVGAVGKQSKEGVAQLGTALSGKSTPAVDLRVEAEDTNRIGNVLGTVRDLFFGSFSAATPYSAAGGHMLAEVVEYHNRGYFTDEVIKAHLADAKLHFPEAVPYWERMLVLTPEQRANEKKEAARMIGEVGTGMASVYTSGLSALAKIVKSGGAVAKEATAAGRVAAKEAVGATAEGTARQVTPKRVPGLAEAPGEAPVGPAGAAAEAAPVVGASAKMTPEQFVEQIAAPGAETILERGKRALQTPEVQEWAAKIWDEVRGERGAVGMPVPGAAGGGEAAVKKAGGQFLAEDASGTWFNDPKTGSTLLVEAGKPVTPEAIKAHTVESRVQFKAQEIIDRTNAEGGVSYSATTHDFAPADKGFAVSIAPERGMMVRGPLTAEDLGTFARKNAEVLSDPRAHLGTWKDNAGTTHVDISVIVPDQAEAIALGRQYKQKAIYDFANKTDIPIQDATQGMHPMGAPAAPLTPEEMKIASEYDAALHDPAAKPAWDALMTETEKLYDDISKKINIETVHGAQPYGSIDEMVADMKAGNLKVSDVGIEHPFWTPEQNLKFRAVHDYLGHLNGNDFSLHGEYQAFLAQAEHVLSPEAKRALQTEVYGQAASYYKNQAFGEQKAFLSSENLNLPPVEQRLAGLEGEPGITNALAPRTETESAKAAMPGVAETQAQARAAYEQLAKNETALKGLSDIRTQFQAMVESLKGDETPTFLETLRQIMKDETGAIGAKLPETKRALKLAAKGEGGANWYVGVPEELQKHFGSDWELMSNLIAVTSPNMRVEKNVEYAIDAYAKWKKGLDPAQIGADVPTASAFTKRAVQGLLEGQPLEGVLKSQLKVYNFAQALKGDRNAVVIDRWMWGIFYPEEAAKTKATTEAGTYSGTPARYALVADWMRTQAAKMGMQPADLQAAIWVGAKIDAGDLGGIKPLRDYIAEAMKSGKLEQDAFDFFENVGKTMNEEGRINLATTMMLARASIGATLGGMTGDDPESMARNALIGFGVGSIASGKTARAIGQAFAGTKLHGALDDLAAVLKSESGAMVPGAEFKRPFADFAKKPEPPAPTVRQLDPGKKLANDINTKLQFAKKFSRTYDDQIAESLRSNRFSTIEDVLKVDAKVVKPAEVEGTMKDLVGVRDFVMEDLLETFARAKLSGDPALAREARAKYAFAGRVSQHVTDAESALSKGVARGGSPVGAVDMERFSKDLQGIEAAIEGTMKDSQLVEMVTRQADRAAAAKLAETGSRYPQALWNIYYGLNLLSSPLTHAKNVIGDMAGLGLAIADRAMGELVAIPFHVVGKGQGHVRFGETYELVRGAWEMVADSFRAAKPKGAFGYGRDTFRSGESAFGDVTKAGERLRMLGAKVNDAELGGPRALAKVVDLMSTLAQKNLKFMDGTDEFFKVLTFNGEIRAQARRAAAAEGWTGKDFAERLQHYIDKPTTEMLENAHYYAHENTFTKAFDPEAGGWQHLWGAGATAQAISQTPLVRFAATPFFRTPTRLAEFSLTHTPGLNLIAVQTMSDIAAGGAKADLAVGKLVTGLGVAGLTFYAATHGYITGAWPKDLALKERYKGTGWRPYSLYNPWTGKYWSYAGIEPISTMLAGAANLAQYAPHLEDHQFNTVVQAMALSYKDGIFNNPFLQGASDISDVIESMNREDNVGKMLEWVGKRAASLVPFGALGRNLARSASDVERETRTVDDAPPELREMDTVINQFRQTVPGWSDTRPAKMNMITGEPVPAESGWLGFALPYQISSNANDKVLNELVALGGAGLPKEVPRVLGGNMPRDNIIVKESDIKEGVLLTDDERTEFTRLLTHAKNDEGRTLHQELNHQMFEDNEDYKDASKGRDGGRAQIIKQIFREFYITAEEKFKEGHPEVANVIERRQLERDLGRLPSSMEDMKDPMRQMLEEDQRAK